MALRGTMSTGAHSQLSDYSPVETNLPTARHGIFAFPQVQELSKISQQTAAIITKERL